jgi:hypothetical protein
MLGGEQYSFSTFMEGFDGNVHNQPYIGMGDLNTQDAWDMEFDYINHRDDGLFLIVPEPGSLILLAVGGVLLGRRRLSAC